MLAVFFYLSLPCSSGSLTGASLAGQQVPGILLFPPPEHLDSGSVPMSLASMGVLGIELWFSSLGNRHLSTEPSPKPKFSFFTKNSLLCYFSTLGFSRAETGQKADINQWLLGGTVDKPSSLGLMEGELCGATS